MGSALRFDFTTRPYRNTVGEAGHLAVNYRKRVSKDIFNGRDPTTRPLGAVTGTDGSRGLDRSGKLKGDPRESEAGYRLVLI